MTREPAPHARYEHLYVVLRVDDFSSADLVEERVAAVSAHLSIAGAQAEAERLNVLAADKRCHYAVLTTRLKDDWTTEADQDG